MSNADPTKNMPRMLALAAFAVTIVAVIVVTGASLGDGTTNGSDPRPQARTEDEQPRRVPDKKKYEVEEGDTLSQIAEKTGISIEELEQLNPDVDPRSLTTGEKLKLR